MAGPSRAGTYLTIGLVVVALVLLILATGFGLPQGGSPVVGPSIDA